MLRPKARRLSRLSLGSWRLPAGAVAAVLVAGSVVIAIGHRAPAAPVLRASFIGAPALTDVRLEPIVLAAPSLPRPIDVPADPYAPEAVVEIGTIEIAKLGLNQRLMDGVTLRNIDQGPSHWPGSAMPGQPGNMVIAGHRVTHSRPFREIDRLVAGDEIVVTAAGQRATYRVTSSLVVRPDQTDIADSTATPSLTLFACHPPGSARQRYVVRADLVI